ncbi:MAG: hypothetical protein U0263_40910 [Polyangiaceae bacterium]
MASPRRPRVGAVAVVVVVLAVLEPGGRAGPGASHAGRGSAPVWSCTYPACRAA